MECKSIDGGRCWFCGGRSCGVLREMIPQLYALNENTHFGTVNDCKWRSRWSKMLGWLHIDRAVLLWAGK